MATTVQISRAGGETVHVNDQRRQLRVGLAQVDTRVGDLTGNAELVTRWTAKAAAAGVHLVVFPEMTLTGYPPEDLVLRESFARASEKAVVDLAATLAEQGHGDVAVVVGYLAHSADGAPGPARQWKVGQEQHGYTLMAVLDNLAVVSKHGLPRLLVVKE